MENYILTLLIFIPVFGAFIMLPVSKYLGNDKSKWVALAATFIQLLLTVWLYMNFVPTEGMQFEVNKQWIPHFNIEYYVGVDGLSFPMVFLTAFLFIQKHSGIKKDFIILSLFLNLSAFVS